MLAAKVNAVLRRAYDMPSTGNILACGEAVLDLDSAALSIHGQSIPLTRNELIILRTLMEQRGRIVSRETLMTRLWQMDEYVEENTLTVNVNRLRKKLLETLLQIRRLQMKILRPQPLILCGFHPSIC